MRYSRETDVKLDYKEQPSFYNQSTAVFKVFATDEWKQPYVKFMVLSIDDTAWDADLYYSADEHFCDTLFERYLNQIPITGVTLENFKEFFGSLGFDFFIN